MTRTMAIARGTRFPSDMERAAANRLREIIAAHAAGDAKLRVLENRHPVEVTLHPALADILLDVLGHIGDGDAVTLVPVGKMLTTQQAADILDVSRPHLISLLEKGAIPFTMTGRHRRIRTEDLLAFRNRRSAEREAALDELAGIDSELL
eukprot:gene27624-30585_t